MIRKAEQGSAGRCLPNLGRAISRSGNDRPPVRAERNTGHAPRMAGEGGEEFTLSCIPKSDRMIRGPGPEGSPVRAEREA